jgi:hypothetical protein
MSDLFAARPEKPAVLLLDNTSDANTVCREVTGGQPAAEAGLGKRYCG